MCIRDRARRVGSVFQNPKSQFFNLDTEDVYKRQLQSGEIDLIYGSALLTWDDYQQATSLPNIAGAVAESDSKTRNLVLNASGVLSDLKVREAVAYAIDKETLSEGLTYGEETPADHLFPDGIPYTDVELNVVRSYDPEKATALLDEAGWVLTVSYTHLDVYKRQPLYHGLGRDFYGIEFGRDCSWRGLSAGDWGLSSAGNLV